jgi:predicted DCC family thiol-disulfide oxidoreductase YuxK
VTQAGPLLLFDADCIMCSRLVRFFVKHERALPADQRLQFESLAEAAKLGVSTPGVDSAILIQNGRVFFESDAILSASKYLRFPFSLLAVLLVIPRFLRDAGYRFFARHRK